MRREETGGKEQLKVLKRQEISSIAGHAGITIRRAFNLSQQLIPISFHKTALLCLKGI
jgi:hypothetical protein